MNGSQIWAIVWAQWRSVINHRSRSREGRFPLVAVFALIWYGLWTFAAASLALAVAAPASLDWLRPALPGGLMLIFVYWQVIPIVMVSTGVSLDFSRLLVYPIPHGQLFSLEVILRVTTCLEMLLISAGLAIGILMNPRLPAWGVLAVAMFAALNLFVSAGLKDLLGRLLARRGIREILVLVLVLLAALPQLLVLATPNGYSQEVLQRIAIPYLPWGAAAELALGAPSALAAAVLIAWAALAWYFGRTQFERTLRFDAAAARSAGRASSRGALLDPVLAFLTRPLRDPLAALVEKEIRFLSRSARFRLLFLMGFSFGLLIWLPIALRGNDDSMMRSNFLTVVSAYALMLLGEVCFWNNFGLDRSAAQGYFTMPVSIATVLKAKNFAAVFFILLELSMVTLFCSLLQMPVTLPDIAEAFAVTLVLTTFLLAFGNLVSVRYPRPVDPAQSWRSGGVGRAQAYLLLLYPVAAAPIALAFGAEYAFDSRAAFYAVLLIDLMIGLTTYAIALESSAKTANATREFLVMALSKGEGPASS